MKAKYKSSKGAFLCYESGMSTAIPIIDSHIHPAVDLETDASWFGSLTDDERRALYRDNFLRRVDRG
jgi:hypothetical protein